MGREVDLRKEDVPSTSEFRESDSKRRCSARETTLLASPLYLQLHLVCCLDVSLPCSHSRLCNVF